MDTVATRHAIRFAKSSDLIRGEWSAIDGSKFRAVASIDTAREKFQLQCYLDSMEKLDNEALPEFDNTGVQAALEKLKHHPEPEVGFMVVGRHTQPAYNLQSSVDAEHALIVAHDVVLDAADNRSLKPMAAAAKAVLGKETSMSLQTRATRMESKQPSAKVMASSRAFPLRGPETHMAMAPSSSATPSAIDPNRTRTSVRTRKR